ncbi:putative magnesium transporter [Acetoanaerobium sticklandii]|uniref:Magnesium transporter MgtE n=1 Tax=Acetoanaerobium sticklandii (strain ATCC 12662 / DSM 519 / JCM 1433 / CCUG 9281 / NCIMB 10654 / HF) TaxID=499177 RepID=E3PR31_ACESD|nr:magnesium transporter [Acetoanaerobium sticklandii]CBH20254.1 putative magnesium transporter [Acetoanaerobium sticklandii]
MEDKNQILEFILESPFETILEQIDEIHPVDFLEALGEFDDDPLIILEKLPDEYVALLLDYAEDDEKFNLLSLFSKNRQAQIISEMSSDELVDLLGTLDEDEQNEIITNMNTEEVEEVKTLLSYDPESAGGIMATEFISIKETDTVNETINYLRTMAPDSETPYYIYVVDDLDVLKGVVPLRQIIVSTPDTLIKDIMIENIISAPVDMDQEEVSHIFEKYGFMAIPVVDHNGEILGIITVDDVMEIMKEEYTEDMFRLAGLDEEEKVAGTVIGAIKSRLPWLLVNLVTATLAAKTVSLFENTIAQIVALATFMPMVAGMGGNAGSQTLTLIIRGIAIGEISYENQAGILKKEIAIGIINGLCLGLVVGVLGYFWVGSLAFGFVIGTAMLLNLIVATISGYLVPILLKKVGIDPALASAVFVTTVTDVLGFFFFLGLATVMLQYLI